MRACDSDGVRARVAGVPRVGCGFGAGAGSSKGAAQKRAYRRRSAQPMTGVTSGDGGRPMGRLEGGLGGL